MDDPKVFKSFLDWAIKNYPAERYGTCADKFNPEAFKKFVENKLKDGATLLGGCCEIKPRHIGALKNLF